MVGQHIWYSDEDAAGVGRQALILIETDARLLGIGYCGLRWNEVLASLQRAEQLLYLRHHRIGVEVAHHHDGLILRLIPTLVEIAHHLGRTVLDDVHVADGKTLREDGIVQEVARELLPKGNGVLQSPFLDDDAALAFDGAVGHRGRTRPVVHQQQAGVQLCRVVAGNAIEQVAHRVATREGIAVVAEVDAVATHEVHDLLPREMLGATEQHVLHEVCHAPFVVLLEH